MTQQNKYFCSCGCGKYIKVKWHHRYEGIPSYINGHNKQKIVDLGNGKRRTIWGGRFPQKGKTKRTNYYSRLSGTKKRHINLGSDLNLAKKFIFAYEKAYHNEIHWHTMVRLLESIIRRIDKTNEIIYNQKVDKSFYEAKKALSRLRKTIKQKEKEVS